MSQIDQYDDDDREDQSVDDDEAQAAQKGSDDDSGITDADLAEAETLTVTAKQHIREQLEDEVARFLANGGKITQVPPDESAQD